MTLAESFRHVWLLCQCGCFTHSNRDVYFLRRPSETQRMWTPFGSQWIKAVWHHSHRRPRREEPPDLPALRSATRKSFRGGRPCGSEPALELRADSITSGPHVRSTCARSAVASGTLGLEPCWPSGVRKPLHWVVRACRCRAGAGPGAPLPLRPAHPHSRL